ncbi:SDR family oxidoreductase [Granulicoccus sp. GXG6511]|uniref:SDR family oxidoreductase n=1 Tax=Granulicoccus sp. GXG6511 TaxID=3381351 RepID=UPI003D7E0233
MASVVLIGGHGKIALLTAAKLINAGHEVTSVFRNPDHHDEVAATGATPRLGDVEAMDTVALADLVSGHDVVVWSAGAGGGNPPRTYAVDRDAAIRSMEAAQEAGVPRYVMVSYLGASTDHGVAEDDPFFPYAESKAAADEHLRSSGLGWTLVMPSRLTDDPSQGKVTPRATEQGPTSRELVADVIVAAVGADPATVSRRELKFTDGDIPIAEALANRPK